MLRTANVQLNVVGLGILADYHAGVDTFTRSDKERTALLGIEETVSQCFSGFKGDERTVFPVLDLAFIWGIAIKGGIHNSVSLRVSQEITSVSDQPAGRDGEFKSCVGAV